MRHLFLLRVKLPQGPHSGPCKKNHTRLTFTQSEAYKACFKTYFCNYHLYDDLCIYIQVPLFCKLDKTRQVNWFQRALMV